MFWHSSQNSRKIKRKKKSSRVKLMRLTTRNNMSGQDAFNATAEGKIIITLFLFISR
jgi:hypothetical protein